MGLINSLLKNRMTKKEFVIPNSIWNLLASVLLHIKRSWIKSRMMVLSFFCQLGMNSKKNFEILPLAIFLTFIFNITTSQAQDTTTISPQLYAVKYSEQLYMHVSKRVDPKWGSFTCNGMVLISEQGKVWLYDTPMDDSITLQLANWVKNDLECTIDALIPNHFHEDCIGGLDVLAKEFPQIYVIANKLTYDLLDDDLKNLGLLFFLFDEISPFEKVQHYYLGAGHATDNIVAWFPEENVLFAGCMVKAKENQSIGYIGSANLKEWPKTIRRVKRKFKKAQVVVPGHGKAGNTTLFKHTLKVISDHKKENKE
jgi:metallo-beta-lactamase class B